jgi:hypothetical protein
MEYIYGFRCHDTRNSLKMGKNMVENPRLEGNKKEEVIIYHTA